jgi:signal transduction histidine kinase
MRNAVRILCLFLLQGLVYSSPTFSAELVLTAEEKQWLADHPIIRLSPDPAFAPIEEVTENGKYVGMAADYMELIEKKTSFKFTVVTYPSWKQVVVETKARNVDVLAAVTQSPQRLEYLNFTTAHIRLPGMIIVSDRTLGTVSIDDLKSMRVASPAGYVWFDLIGYDHPEIKLLEASTLRQGLRDLSFGLLDAVVADPATVTQIIKEEGLGNLRIGGETGYFFDLAFAARKDWPILHSILEKSVQSITRQEHRSIFDRWIQFNAGVGVSRNLIAGLLVGLALFILLAITFMFVNRLLRIRVAKQTQQLNTANERLSRMNVDLEERVKTRTMDLEKAMLKLKKSQAKMVQSEKMAALGQMIAGIAHEINTPLGYARSNVVVMKDFVARVKLMNEIFDAWKDVMNEDSASEEMISVLFREVDHAIAELNQDGLIGECEELVTDTIYGLDQISEITLNLKDFSRLNQAEMAEVNLNDNIQRTLKLAKHLLKDNITLDLSLGEIPLIKCNPSKINQVLLNLITNACHAITVSAKEQGKLSIETSYDGDRVHVSIKDNGIGIPEKVGKKMFDPFYTTKEVGQGTGLGLSISYNIIVKEHKGKISVKTREGVGTRFIISLRTDAAAAPALDHDNSQQGKVQAG